MPDSLYERLKKSDKRYNEDFIQLMIKAGRKRIEFPKKFKEFIFYMSKDFILKNVHNFMRITRYRGNHAPFDEEDAILECYLVLEQCILKFKFGGGNKFFFYYNRSLTTRMTRISQYRWVHHPDYPVTSLDVSIDEDGHNLFDLLADENSNDNTMNLMIKNDMETLGIDSKDFDLVYQAGLDNNKKKEVQILRNKLKNYYT